MAAMAPLPELLHSRGLRVTAQRVVINDALHAAGRHLTADQVRDAVQERLPGVSLPTVYATLELLEELGLVRRVATEGGTVVYDPRTDEHHHAVCRRCGTITDLDAPVDRGAAVSAAATAGFAVEDARVIVRGLCPACRGH
jgi:Fe2+ or Zn2+ uptake regulation protein